MNTIEQIEYYKEIVSKEITKTRYEHSIRVAEIAFNLSEIHGTDPEKAYLAGILHDITKQKLNSFHIELFKKFDFLYNDIPEEAYHPYSATFYLQDVYGFKDLEVLSAVKNHTLGGENLNRMDEILYVSDFLGSDFANRMKEFPDWMDKTKMDLNFGILLKASFTMMDLCKKMLSIHKSTFLMYDRAVKNVKK